MNNSLDTSNALSLTGTPETIGVDLSDATSLTGVNTGNATSLTWTPEIIGVHIMLGIFIVVGVIGNILVLVVYVQKRDKLTVTVFINALALIDLLTCGVTIPCFFFEMYMDTLYDNIGQRYDAFCKILAFLNSVGPMASTFMMAAISIDRYLFVCRPFFHMQRLGKRKVKITIGILTFISCLYGIAVSTVYHDNPSTNKCDTYNNTAAETFITYYKYVHNATFWMAGLVALVVYSVMFCTVKRQEKFRQKYMVSAITKVRKLNLNAKTTLMVSRSHPAGDESTMSASSKIKHPHQMVSRDKASGKANAASSKLALMFFVIYVIFTLSFLPPSIVIFQVVTFNWCIYFMYFVNNISNPFVYFIMNDSFRKDLKKLCF